jgi:hypothetical protein
MGSNVVHKKLHNGVWYYYVFTRADPQDVKRQCDENVADVQRLQLLQVEPVKWVPCFLDRVSPGQTRSKKKSSSSAPGEA